MTNLAFYWRAFLRSAYHIFFFIFHSFEDVISCVSMWLCVFSLLYSGHSCKKALNAGFTTSLFACANNYFLEDKKEEKRLVVAAFVNSCLID